MDVDGGDEMAGSAGDPDAETPEGDGGSEHEGRDEADADALDDDDDEPAIRLGPLPGSAEQLKAVTAFTRAAYLRRSGSMEVRPLSKANCEKEGSAFAPFAYVFSLPPPEKLNRLLTNMTKVLREEKKHHDGPCFQPDGEAGEAGCGCMRNGTRFIKQLAVETDERKLVSLFQPGSSCHAFIRPEHSALSAAELAHQLALQLAATERATTPLRHPAAGKRRREAASSGKTPGTAARGGSSSSSPPATGDDSCTVVRCSMPPLCPAGLPPPLPRRSCPSHSRVCPDAAAAVPDLAP